MHNVGSRSIWRRAGQMLSVLIVATLVVFGLGNNPSRAATPVLNVSITPEKTSYNSGDTQKYTVSWSCTSVTEDCVDSVIKVRIPHAVNQAGDAVDKAVAANLAATAASGTPAVSGISLREELPPTLTLPTTWDVFPRVTPTKLSSPSKCRTATRLISRQCRPRFHLLRQIRR